MKPPTLPERAKTLQEQLRAHRSRLAEARATVKLLRLQCAQIEGAIALCDALIVLESQVDPAPAAPPTNGADQGAAHA